jgi:hypothetical protein
MIQQITRNDPPVGWAAQGIDGHIRAHAMITIEPIDGSTRSRVTVTLDFEGHGLGVSLVRLVRRQAQKGRSDQLPEPQKPAGERSVAD